MTSEQVCHTSGSMLINRYLNLITSAVMCFFSLGPTNCKRVDVELRMECLCEILPREFYLLNPFSRMVL